jgi:hypothetical protein
MLSKLANQLVQALREHGPAAALAAGLPMAYAASEAPEGHRMNAMGQALKGTVLGTIPGAVMFPGDPRKALASGAAGGFAWGDRAAREGRSAGQAQKTRALIDALGKRIVPREFQKIEQGAAQ